MGKTQEGAVRLLVQGLYRFKVEEIVDTEPYLQARVTPMTEGYDADLEIDGMVSGLKALFQKMPNCRPICPPNLPPWSRNSMTPGSWPTSPAAV